MYSVKYKLRRRKKRDEKQRRQEIQADDIPANNLHGTMAFRPARGRMEPERDY
jgi:hypothetical protein